MKHIIKSVYLILLFTVISLPVFSQAGSVSINQSYSTGLYTVVTIDVKEAKAVRINYSIDITQGSDNLIFYDINSSGGQNATGVTPTGYTTGTYVTSTKTGKAVINFYCGTAGTKKIELQYSADNSITTSSDLTVGGNTIITGRLGVGTSSTTKKVELWDNSASRFTFSGASCTSGYEVAQTIDNTGYKINVGSSIRDYRISIAGTDYFKLTSNVYAIGVNALSSITTGYQNIGIGGNAMKSNTTGSQNTAIGTYSLESMSSATGNTAIGTSSLRYLTTGYHNTSIGHGSLQQTTTGYYNIAVGTGSLNGNTTGYNNSSLGFASLYSITTGTNNVGIGYYSGAYITDGTTKNSTASNSIFIGSNTRANADGQTNQIVIGGDAIGNGSNTVTLGNDNIISTFLKGNVGIGTGTTAPDFKLTVNGNFKVTNGSNFMYYDGAADFVLKCNSRGGGGRALVHDGGNSLTLNYANDFSGGTRIGTNILFLDGGNSYINTGNLGIGTNAPDEKLTVKGKIHAEEVIVDLNVPVADYVFGKEYKLMPLHKVEEYVNANSHLPEVPSAAEIKEKGMSMGEMQNKLLQKVEELTLYVIQQQKEIESLKKQLSK